MPDKLTGADFRIAVCHGCGRYGQVSRETSRCATATPPVLADDEFFRRVRACHRITQRKAERGY